MSTKLCPECESILKNHSDDGSLSDPTPAVCPVCNWHGRWSDGLWEPRIILPKPALPYVSIDIETTGLDPQTCQILEIGAVYDDWTRPIPHLPEFHCYVTHSYITGNPYALALNAEILRKLANPQKSDLYLSEDEVAAHLAKWLHPLTGGSVATPAGKNFASFDRQFLKRLPDFERKVRLHHRTIDPAMLFWLPSDDKLPDSKTCYERAGLDEKVSHTAISDARAVVWLIRAGVKRLPSFWKRAPNDPD